MGALCCCCGNSGQSHVQLADSLVRFDKLRGPKVSIGNFTVSGSGTAIANSSLLQNQTYFEVILLSCAGPPWSIGLTSNRKHDLNLHTLIDRPDTVCLSSSQSSSLSLEFKQDDVIGVLFDQSQVKPTVTFTINGSLVLGVRYTGLKGDQYPCVAVGEGTQIQVNFGQSPFKTQPPHGFEAPILTRSLI